MTPLAGLQQTFGKGWKMPLKNPQASAPSQLTIKEVTCAYIRGSLFVK